MAGPCDLRGLYAITPAALCGNANRMIAAVEAALRGGARLIQYRDKLRSHPSRHELADALQRRCRSHGAKLIVNDDIELAALIGADGVHLGADDASLAEARARLGADAIIGITCADSLPRARAAALDGANYVAFGAFFPTQTKQDARRADLDLLRIAKVELAIPICAIGGITVQRAAPLIGAGADLIAAVEGVFAAPDIEVMARAYALLFAPDA